VSFPRLTQVSKYLASQPGRRRSKAMLAADILIDSREAEQKSHTNGLSASLGGSLDDFEPDGGQ
jgi:hypothetical protein